MITVVWENQEMNIKGS